MNQKIYDLILQGYSNEEIGLLCNYTPKYINDYYILSLKKEGHKLYNPKLYDYIMFIRSIKNDFVDKDVLEEICDYVKNGYNFVEIAIILNMTIEEIKK